MKKFLIISSTVLVLFLFFACSLFDDQIDLNAVYEIEFSVTTEETKGLSSGEGRQVVPFSELEGHKFKLVCLEGTGYCSVSGATQQYVQMPNSTISLGYGKWKILVEGYKGNTTYFSNGDGLVFYVGKQGVSNDNRQTWSYTLKICESYSYNTSTYIKANTDVRIRNEAGKTSSYSGYELKWYLTKKENPANLSLYKTLGEMTGQSAGFYEWVNPSEPTDATGITYVAAVLVSSTNPSVIYGSSTLQLGTLTAGEVFTVGGGSSDYVQFGKYNTNFKTRDYFFKENNDDLSAFSSSISEQYRKYSSDGVTPYEENSTLATYIVKFSSSEITSVIKGGKIGELHSSYTVINDTVFYGDDDYACARLYKKPEGYAYAWGVSFFWYDSTTETWSYTGEIGADENFNYDVTIYKQVDEEELFGLESLSAVDLASIGKVSKVYQKYQVIQTGSVVDTRGSKKEFIVEYSSFFPNLLNTIKNDSGRTSSSWSSYNNVQLQSSTTLCVKYQVYDSGSLRGIFICCDKANNNWYNSNINLSIIQDSVYGLVINGNRLNKYTIGDIDPTFDPSNLDSISYSLSTVDSAEFSIVKSGNKYIVYFPQDLRDYYMAQYGRNPYSGNPFHNYYIRQLDKSKVDFFTALVSKNIVLPRASYVLDNITPYIVTGDVEYANIQIGDVCFFRDSEKGYWKDVGGTVHSFAGESKKLYLGTNVSSTVYSLIIPYEVGSFYREDNPTWDNVQICAKYFNDYYGIDIYNGGTTVDLTGENLQTILTSPYIQPGSSN